MVVTLNQELTCPASEHKTSENLNEVFLTDFKTRATMRRLLYVSS